MVAPVDRTQLPKYNLNIEPVEVVVIMKNIGHAIDGLKIQPTQTPTRISPSGASTMQTMDTPPPIA